MNVQQMLNSGTSLVWAERYLHEGRISQRAFDWYCLFADWSAPRFSGTAGFKQERLYNRRGKDFYYRRIERIRTLHDAVKSGQVQLSH